MKVFMYEDKPYIKIIPSKRLFNSTMVHEVVTRGDFFAVNLQTNIFTVLPAGADTYEVKNISGNLENDKSTGRST